MSHGLQDSGLATLESFDINFENNVIENCKYGVRLSLGAGRNKIQYNTFSTLSRCGAWVEIRNHSNVIGPENLNCEG